jgi:hypothetical protein
MNLFFWKSNRLIDSFANELANELFSHIQPEAAKQYLDGVSDKKQTKKFVKKMQNELKGLVKRINEFKVINSLGVYGKARLHLKFRLRLEELGYDPRAIEKINQVLMVETP